VVHPGEVQANYNPNRHQQQLLSAQDKHQSQFQGELLAVAAGRVGMLSVTVTAWSSCRCRLRSTAANHSLGASLHGYSKGSPASTMSLKVRAAAIALAAHLTRVVAVLCESPLSMNLHHSCGAWRCLVVS
jgi:hypothetical protein